MATEQQLREYLKRAAVDLAETRARLEQAEERRTEPIAVIGMSCRYPGGADTVANYWRFLRGGGNGVCEIPSTRWDPAEYYNPDRRTRGGVYTRHGAFLDDIAGWDAEFFGHSPREALMLDPQQRLLAELVWEALEDAGTPAPSLAGSRTGVFAGFMDFLQYGRLEIERSPGIAAEPHFGQGVSASVVAGRLAYQYDLRGPAITLDTACSSSLIAAHLAVEALRRDECELAVASGASLLIHPDLFVQACATSMLSADGACKTFDSRADGYVMGEGGGVVVLERLSSALRNGHRVRAVIRGSAANQDGRSNGLSAPSRSAQADVIRRALATARVTPDEVDYVEAHGSGTRLGDAIELSALHDVFGGRSPNRPLRVGAVKTNIGHTLAAAGVAGLIKTVLSLENGHLPPNLHFTQPARGIPRDGTVTPVGTDPRHTGLAPRIAGVSGFGWSGSNAHMVLTAAAEVDAPATAEPNGIQVLPCSAASAAALRAHLERLSGRLTDRPDLAVTDVAHTLRTGRAAHEFRRAVLVADTADAARELAAAAPATTVRRVAERPVVAFLLPGVGDQYRGLGSELYRTEPVYAEAVDRCVALLLADGIDLRPLFEPAGRPAGRGDLAALLGRTGNGDSAPDPLDHAEHAHPFLFTVEYALAALLSSWRITPDLLVGYSLGEYVAACLAGVFSLADALAVVVARARLIAEAPAGRMVAVAAAEDRVLAALPADSPVAVAAVNGPAMTVLSGPDRPVEEVTAALGRAGLACRPLRSAHAFHSALLEPARAPLAALVESVPRHAPGTSIVSNRTGATLTAAAATSADYWADHLVHPVRFADGVRHALESGVDVFVELGAGHTLGGLVRQGLAGDRAVDVLGTLPAAWSDGAGDASGVRTELVRTCAALWEAGVDVDWAAVHGGTGRLVDLPAYPFQRTEFWPEPAARKSSVDSPVEEPAEPADLAFAPAWRQDTTTAPARDGFPAPLPGTLVVFCDADGVGARLAEAAAAVGTAVVEVRPGAAPRRGGGHLVLDPADPAQYREVTAACADGPVHLVHLWGLDTPAGTPGFPGDEELGAAVTGGFDTLLHTLQAFGERELRLLTVSRGAVEVLGGDATAPHRAIGHGFGRAAAPEYPGLTWHGVDLDAESTGPAADAAALVAELTRPAGEPDPLAGLVGWRRGRRWVRHWDTAADVVAAQDPPVRPWRADGTYLITGGTRGLGMGLARHLVAAGVRKLALVGRTPLRPDPALAPDSPVAVSLRAVADLEAAGAEVLLLTADVGDPGRLRDALRQCRQHFGALHGVVHAAGVPAGGLVARRTVAETAAVLAPKVRAMGPLAELVGPGTPETERPELLVLYSSAVTAFGGVGESDYCAANTVLDACGEALAAHAPSTRVLTVAWGPWQHDTWQADGLGTELGDRVRTYRQRWGFADDAGCAFLDRLLGTTHGSVLAVRQPLAPMMRDWSAMTDITSLAHAVPTVEAGKRFPRPRLRTEFSPPRTAKEITIAEVWGSFLGIDQVGVHDPFFDLGGNSLLGLAMVLAIEREMGVAIPPAVLFEHPTVAAFAAAVDGGHGNGSGNGNGNGHTNGNGGTRAAVVGSSRGARRRQARGAGRESLT